MIDKKFITAAITLIMIIMGNCLGFAATGQDKNIISIGFSAGTLREERWLRDTDMFIAEAKKKGAIVNILFANENSDTQISQAENLIIQGIDILVVVPNDAYAAAVIIEKAHKKGIKVIAYDRLIKNCDLDFYVSFDSVKVGELEAQGVLDIVNKGKFAYIGGAETDNNAFLLKEGSMRILDPKIKSGDIALVLDKFTPDWKPEEAYKNMKAYLDVNKTIDAVVAANDGTAFGVIQALKEYGLAGKVPVSGQDAELSACQRIIEGTQALTVYKPIRSLAKRAAEIAVMLAKGQSPESNNKLNNGKIDVPAYLVEPITVTRDNIKDTVIKDGFHSYDDVYRNSSAK